MRILLTFLITLCTLMPLQTSLAHNKVVVIPLGADDAPAEIEPFAPLAAASPATSDYTVMSTTVIDNVTGLEWQRQDDDVPRTWEGAWSYCVSLNLGGKTDWRLPNYYELQSIIDYGTLNPAINTIAFTNINIGPNDGYWTSTSYSFIPSRASSFYGDEGDVNTYANKTGTDYARCVRNNGNVAAWAGLFEDNNNGSVTDLATGLIWQAEDDSTQRAHAVALTYCAALTLAGSSNWRLPNIKELNSITDLRMRPEINANVFLNNKRLSYWSATSSVSNSAYAWVVDYGAVGFGNVSKRAKSDSFQIVRCVR